MAKKTMNFGNFKWGHHFDILMSEKSLTKKSCISGFCQNGGFGSSKAQSYQYLRDGSRVELSLPFWQKSEIFFRAQSLETYQTRLEAGYTLKNTVRSHRNYFLLHF